MSRTLQTFRILVLITIFVVILVALFSPVIGPRNRPPPKVMRAKTEIFNIIVAIGQYETTYGRMPIDQKLLSVNSNDFTFGTFDTSAAAFGITNRWGRQANNSKVMAALLDLPRFGNGKDSPNVNHTMNPQKTPFLNAKMRGDTNSPGVGLDGVYRDPWGNPYIISIDLNFDGQCRDAFYCQASVSEKDSGDAGFFGLNRIAQGSGTNRPIRDSFEAQTHVMVWSLGPDGKADASKKANEGVNRDNVTSWY